jgi:hypothetical protein
VPSRISDHEEWDSARFGRKIEEDLNERRSVRIGFGFSDERIERERSGRNNEGTSFKPH